VGAGEALARALYDFAGDDGQLPFAEVHTHLSPLTCHLSLVTCHLPLAASCNQPLCDRVVVVVAVDRAIIW
jgi:hypothetical protein